MEVQGPRESLQVELQCHQNQTLCKGLNELQNGQKLAVRTCPVGTTKPLSLIKPPSQSIALSVVPAKAPGSMVTAHVNGQKVASSEPLQPPPLNLQTAGVHTFSSRRAGELPPSQMLGPLTAVPIKVPQVSSLHRLAGQAATVLPQVRPKTQIPDSLPHSPCQEPQPLGLQRAPAVVSPKSQGPTLPTANSTFSPDQQPNSQSAASPPPAPPHGPSGGPDPSSPAQHASPPPAPPHGPSGGPDPSSPAQHASPPLAPPHGPSGGPDPSSPAQHASPPPAPPHGPSGGPDPSSPAQHASPPPAPPRGPSGGPDPSSPAQHASPPPAPPHGPSGGPDPSSPAQHASPPPAPPRGPSGGPDPSSPAQHASPPPAPPRGPSGGPDPSSPAQHASAGPGVACALIASSPATGAGVSAVSEAVKVIIIQPPAPSSTAGPPGADLPPQEAPPTPKSPSQRKKDEDEDEDHEKIAFMVALGLVTTEHLEEIQMKRQERKRRSTANPAYSGLFEPERKRLASHYLNSALFLSARDSEDFCWKEDVEHDDHCAICKEDGELQLCHNCPRAFHPPCLQPPLRTPPRGPWYCPKCQKKVLNKENMSWPQNFVQSYVTHKTVRQEEKRRLLRRNNELKKECSHLEEQDEQLNQTLKQCQDVRERLLDQQRDTHASLDRLKSLIRLIQRDQLIQVTMTTTATIATSLLSQSWIKPTSTAAPGPSDTPLQKNHAHSQDSGDN